MKTLVLATGNEDKIREIEHLFTDLDINVLSKYDFSDFPDVVEDADTLEGNAIKKAETISKFLNMPALADDTGLEVAALDGKPGVFSARYAGEGATYEQNVDKLLAEMAAIPDLSRKAQFRTVIALAIGARIFTVEGICKGMILRDRRGSKGFGYDPVFYIPELGKTFAEMTLEEKSRISHRGVAFRKAHDLIKQEFGA